MHRRLSAYSNRLTSAKPPKWVRTTSDTKERRRVGSQQTNQGQRLGFIPRHGGVKFDRPGAFLKLIAPFGVEPVKQVGNEGWHRSPQK